MKNIGEDQVLLFGISNGTDADLTNADGDTRSLNALDRANVIMLGIEGAVFDEGTPVRSGVLRTDTVHCPAIGLDIDLGGVGHINFDLRDTAVATALRLMPVVFDVLVLGLVLILILGLIAVAVATIVVGPTAATVAAAIITTTIIIVAGLIPQLIALRFDMKVLLAVNTVLDKLLHHATVGTSDDTLLRVKGRQGAGGDRAIGALSGKGITGLLALRGRVGDGLNKPTGGILEGMSRSSVGIIHRLVVLNVMGEIGIISLTQAGVKEEDKEVDFQLQMGRHINNVDVNALEAGGEVGRVLTLNKVQL